MFYMNYLSDEYENTRVLLNILKTAEKLHGRNVGKND